jgi:acyl-CoA dehydrogenase
MDVVGGAALCRGPRNYLANAHASAPIGITVEGANILTRTLIIYGQGALRCHPYARREVEALAKGDGTTLAKVLARHTVFFVGSVLRALALGLTRGRAARTGVRGELAPYARRLAWASARFAALSDLALVANGARLKQRGRLTGRFADALSWLYLQTATLRRFEAEGRRAEDLPLAQWALAYGEQQIQAAFEGILANFEAPLLGPLLRGPGLLWCRMNALGSAPSDRVAAGVAAILRQPGQQRDRLTAGVYVPTDTSEAIGRLENAFRLAVEAAPILDRIREQSRARRLSAGPPESLAMEAVAAGIVTEAEASLVREAAAAREDAIQVDSFTLEEYRRFGALAEEERAPQAAPA